MRLSRFRELCFLHRLPHATNRRYMVNLKVLGRLRGRLKFKSPKPMQESSWGVEDGFSIHKIRQVQTRALHMDRQSHALQYSNTVHYTTLHYTTLQCIIVLFPLVGTVAYCINKNGLPLSYIPLDTRPSPTVNYILLRWLSSVETSPNTTTRGPKEC